MGGGTSWMLRAIFSQESSWTCWPKGSDVALCLPKWHPVTCTQLKVGCDCPDCNIPGCQEDKATLAITESPALSQAAGWQPPGPCWVTSLHPDLPAHSPGRKCASRGASPPGQDGDPAADWGAGTAAAERSCGFITDLFKTRA